MRALTVLAVLAAALAIGLWLWTATGDREPCGSFAAPDAPLSGSESVGSSIGTRLVALEARAEERLVAAFPQTRPEGGRSVAPARPTVRLECVRPFAGTPPVLGERLRIHVSVPRLPTVRLRAVDEAGQPLSGTALRVGIYAEVVYEMEVWMTRTDGEGHFDVELEDGGDDVERTLLVELSEAGEARGAHVDLTGVWPPRVQAAGDVVMASLPVLVSGRVSDADGRPIEGAWLFVEWTSDPAGDSWRNWVGWHRTALTGDDGRFVVKSPACAASVRVCALTGLTGWSWSTEQITVHPGAQQVELVLLEP